jgi:hypothetical protein
MLKQTLLLCALICVLLSSQVAVLAQAQPMSQTVQAEQSVTPNLPAEDVTTKPILALLSAFNSAQADQIKQFIREHTDKDFQNSMPIVAHVEHVEQFQSLARQHGKIGLWIRRSTQRH